MGCQAIDEQRRRNLGRNDHRLESRETIQSNSIVSQPRVKDKYQSISISIIIIHFLESQTEGNEFLSR
jgi:hypothetical protein